VAVVFGIVSHQRDRQNQGRGGDPRISGAASLSRLGSEFIGDGWTYFRAEARPVAKVLGVRACGLSAEGYVCGTKGDDRAGGWRVAERVGRVSEGVTRHLGTSKSADYASLIRPTRYEMRTAPWTGRNGWPQHSPA
jgi:hypothetical protein